MKNYAKEKGSELIQQHAYDFINKRLRPAHIENDGKQTPTRRNSHPVFLAQHACACCCRGCLEKWHHIPKGRELTDEEVDEIVKLLMMWINAELKRQDSK
jgi:exodeoxyribonuclease V alpha subunit